MPQLTQKHFDETMRSIAQTLTEHGGRFDRIDGRLDKIDARLDRIETLLWHGQRIEEIERRVTRLAELAGDASLATPFRPPVAASE